MFLFNDPSLVAIRYKEISIKVSCKLVKELESVRSLLKALDEAT